LPLGERGKDLSVLLGNKVPFVPYTLEYTEVLVVPEVVPDLVVSLVHLNWRCSKAYENKTCKDRSGS
jgi:hypothetical protein